MSFIKSIRIYTIFFYVLGLAPCHSKQSSSTPFVFGDMLKFFWFLLCAILAVNCFRIVNFTPTLGDFTKSDSVIFSVDITFEFLRVAMVFIQCLSYKQHFQDIGYYFQCIESHFLISLQHRIAYGSFKKRFGWKVVIIALSYLQYIVVRFVQARKTRYFRFSSQLRILQAITMFTFLHIIFYIEALSFHLTELNDVIRSGEVQTSSLPALGTSNTNTNHYRNKLKSVKIIHFHLWLASQRVNNAFGWVLIVLFLYAFSDFTLCVFWFYEELYSGENFDFLMSMNRFEFLAVSQNVNDRNWMVFLQGRWHALSLPVLLPLR